MWLDFTAFDIGDMYGGVVSLSGWPTASFVSLFIYASSPGCATLEVAMISSWLIGSLLKIWEIICYFYLISSIHLD